MEHRTIPNTDLEVSKICMGSANLGMQVPPEMAHKLLDAYIDRGGNFVDTARVYMDWLPGGANMSETTIGSWLKQRGNRDQIVLATKGAHPRLETMHISRFSREEIQQDIHDSLKYLQTDVIDLYWLHRDDSSMPVGEILEIMNEQVQAGTIRYFGCSNWTVERIQAAKVYADAHSIMGFAANQPQWSAAEPNRESFSDTTIVIADQEDVDFHRKTLMTMIPYSSQARGFFTKLDQNKLKDGDRKQYDNPTNRARFERIKELSQMHQTTVTAVALSYVTSQAFPAFPIVAFSNMDQLEDTLQDTELVLSPEEIELIEGA